MLAPPFIVDVLPVPLFALCAYQPPKHHAVHLDHFS